MAYRLPGERVALDLDGPSVEVERVAAWPLAWAGLSLVTAFYAAKKPEAEFAALADIGRFFVTEAQPIWDIVDHRGIVPATPDGFLRLPDTLSLEIVRGWLETHKEQTSAVDEMIAPGPARDELKRRLRAKKVA